MEKGYLFIGNGTKPTLDEAESLMPKKLSNVSLIPAKIAEELGFTIFLGINRNHPEMIECEDIKAQFYDQHTYRSIFAIKDNIIAYRNLCNFLSVHPEIEFLHCNTPIGGVVGRLAGKKYGIKKIVYTAHGFHFYKGAPLINRTCFKWVEKYLARYTDAIITMNEEDFVSASKFSLRNNGAIYKIPGVGVDVSSFQNLNVNVEKYREEFHIPSDAIVGIGTGDVVPRKNYKCAIKSIAECHNPFVHYVICGKGNQTEELMKYSEELGVESQIHFAGFRKDIRQLLTFADFFLFCSNQEGLPRSMMEAMSAGLPCIVSKIRGHVDLIEDHKGGRLIPVNDSKGFADAIEDMIKDQTLMEKYRAYNLERIKEYDIEVVKAKFREIYQDIISK